MIKINIIKKTIQKRCLNLGYNPFLGAKVRKRRLELKLTLEDVAESICSVSYLSKIETGKAKMNDVYVKKILKRLNLDDSVMNYDVQHEIMQKLILSQLNDDELLFDEIINEFSLDPDSHLFLVAEFLIAIKELDYNKAYYNFQKLLDIRDSFTMSDYYVLVISLLNCIIKAGTINDAYEALSLFDSSFLCEYKYSDFLLAKLKLIIAIRSCDFYEAELNYMKALDYYLDNESFEYIRNVNHNICLRRYILGYPIKKIILTKSEEKIFNAIDAIKNDDYSILNVIDDYNNPDEHFYRLLVYNHFKKNNSSIINLFEYSGVRGVIVEAFKHKNLGEDDYKVFLRDTAIPEMIRLGDKIALKYLSNLYKDALAEKARYKEIYLLNRKLSAFLD